MMWKDSYKLGVDRIDDQHQELFKRLTSFIKIVRRDNVEWEDKLDEVKETLAFMHQYVEEHFSDEEEYQQEIDYPNYPEHREEHKKFKAGIEKFAEKFEEEGYTEELMLEFSGKLMTWLINHVTGTDQKIGDYLEELEKEGQ